jgi:uncharacterized protein (DUF362 family)
MQRREFVNASLLAAATATASKRTLGAAPTKLGIPGPYPGKVVSVHHAGSIVSGAYQREPVRQMMRKGMMDLTGAPNWVEAWRVFAGKGDVVGIKLNPVGKPHVISAPEVLHEIVDGLKEAGVKTSDIVAYDRYKRQFLDAGFDKWLPEGVRFAWATDQPHPLQLDMDGYERDVFMEMPLAQPGQNVRDAHLRRSYVARFLTRQVNKMINLAVLKHHQSAGVTLALKNMSHGLVNNVNRSHPTKTLNACGVFIPAVVDLPVIRDKVVLHILDGVKGAYHGGPGSKVGKYMWEHKTMYFATDPVAMDRIGWRVIDEKRAELGLAPIALLKPDADSTYLNCQPEHIEIAGALGLGEFEDSKIQWSKFSIGS